MRRVAVQHEPPEQVPTADEREEGEGPDPLLAHDALEGRLVAGGGKVLDEHRLRILGVRRPGRAALRGRAIAVGEPAPGAEAEHARVVGQQDRGPVGAGRLEKRVECGLEHLVERVRAGHGVGKAVDGVEIAQPRAELLTLAHVAGRPEHEAQLAGLVANRGSVDLEPRETAARPGGA